jgi:AcrR family transcriptional regulator
MDIKEKIIAGARKMFIKFGIRGMTMDFIAEQLGVSKRTIYENFKDKDELLTHCIEVGMKEQSSKNEESIRNSENTIEATFKFIKNSIDTLDTINPLFFFDIEKYYPNLWKTKIIENENQNLNHIIELLNQGIGEDLFRKEINGDIVARLILEQFKMLSNHELFPNDKFSKVDVFENIMINFLRGIATRKGLLLIKKYNS